MKKILITLLLAFLSFVLIAQERELSDYEKYRMEKEKELYEEPNEEIFYIVEDMPKFQGKDAKEFKYWIAQNIRYPKEAVKKGISGKVIVSFIVDETGKVSYAKIEKGVDDYLDAEALRVVTASPKWTAGKQRGKAVKVQFTFPIKFVLDTPQEEQAEPVVINNYYNDNTYPNYRFLLTFDYHWRPYYQSYYSYYDPFYDPWYYGYNYGYPYRTHYYPYYGHSYYGWNYPSYRYNRYYYSYNYKPRGRYYGSTSALGTTRHHYSPYNKTYRSGSLSRTTSVRNPVRSVTTTRNTKSRTATNTKNRTYTPSYTKPRTTTRQLYNKPATRTRPTSTSVRTQSRTSRSTTYSRPSSSSRSSSSYSRPTQSRSRSYSAPSRAPSRSYSAPSRSSSRSSYSKSSSSSRSSSSSSRGSATRSSSRGRR